MDRGQHWWYELIFDDILPNTKRRAIFWDTCWPKKSQLFICSMQIKSKIRKWFVNKSPSCTLYTYVKDDISSMFVSYSDNDDERLLVILHFLSIIKHVSCTWTVLKTYWKLWQKMERQRCTCYFSSESSFCKGVSIFFNTYS